MKNLILMALLTTLSLSTQAAVKKTSSTASNKKINLSADVDTLGGNQQLMDKAQSLRSETRTRIVQDRIVNRNAKLELGLSYGGVMGGDAYLKSQAIGAQAHFHFTPRWSLGVQYMDYSNSLTTEGQRVFEQFRAQQNAGGGAAYAVDIDYPINSAMAVINWYPIYGKTSFLDMGVTQFDIYLLAAGGAIQLSSGTSATYAAGLGIGAWVSKHFSIRTEAKYQTYEDKPITGDRKLHTANLSLALGWIL